jgi:hypothetical protein
MPTRLHAFGYAAGNPLLYVDPLGLDAGQVDSTSARAQEDMGYQAGLNDNNKDRGNWAQGCAAGLADNWKKVDGGAMEGTHSPEYLAGLREVPGREPGFLPQQRHREEHAGVLDGDAGAGRRDGLRAGGGSALLPVGGDVNNLPSNMQSSAAACQFGVGAATAVT